jgi:hypothetical protein
MVWKEVVIGKAARCQMPQGHRHQPGGSQAQDNLVKVRY